MQLGAAALIQQAEVLIYDDLGTQVRSSRPAHARLIAWILDWDEPAQLQTEAPSQAFLMASASDASCSETDHFTLALQSRHVSRLIITLALSESST